MCQIHTFNWPSSTDSILSIVELWGQIAGWVNHLQEFDFWISCHPGPLLFDAHALWKLHVNKSRKNTEAVNHIKLWESTEAFQFVKGKYHVPPTMIKKMLHLYHNTPGSRRYDGLWCTYKNLLMRFTWPGIKNDISIYIRECHLC